MCVTAAQLVYYLFLNITLVSCANLYLIAAFFFHLQIWITIATRNVQRNNVFKCSNHVQSYVFAKNQKKILLFLNIESYNDKYISTILLIDEARVCIHASYEMTFSCKASCIKTVLVFCMISSMASTSRFVNMKLCSIYFCTY